MESVKEGKHAPPFTLKDQAGKKVSLREFQGRDLVLYFYSKDNTSG